VIETVVEDAQDASGLTRLRFGNRILTVPPLEASRGTPVRVRIAARHVAIALEAPQGTSFQNVFAGRVDEILDTGLPFIDVRLDIGCPLWARITRKSFLELDIKSGQSVFALIKSVAVSLGCGADTPGLKE
jgi:molybdate transport system ATP-binding protein